MVKNMQRNKNGPTISLKEGVNAIYLRNTETIPRAIAGAGRVPAGGVFKVSRDRGVSILMQQRFLPATKKEVEAHLLAKFGKDGLDAKLKEKELKLVLKKATDYFEVAPPWIDKQKTWQVLEEKAQEPEEEEKPGASSEPAPPADDHGKVEPEVE